MADKEVTPIMELGFTEFDARRILRAAMKRRAKEARRFSQWYASQHKKETEST